jgi:hypothetical protein
MLALLVTRRGVVWTLETALRCTPSRLDEGADCVFACVCTVCMCMVFLIVKVYMDMYFCVCMDFFVVDDMPENMCMYV